MKKFKLLIYRFYTSFAWKMLVASYLIAIVGGLSLFSYQQLGAQKALIAQVGDSEKVVSELSEVAKQYESLKADDQVKKNEALTEVIDNIQKTYEEGAKLFEDRADLAITTGKVATVDKELAKFLSLLGAQKWVEASDQAKKVRADINKIIAANIPKVTVPATSTASNALPGSGYSRQRVSTSRGEFVVSMVSAPGARVIVETASDSDCSDNCPTKTLAEHVAASGGFAGINGAYFCPPDYPRCQGKTNTFDTLAVNGRSKAVLNRANNVYSVVPLMAAYGNNLSFYDQTVQWGVDTSSTGALANHPRLVRDGSTATGDDSGKGVRGFIGKKDNTIVIGHVYSASLQDTAEVLVTLGVQNALNLDGGGSTALWFEGSYKAGPGRSLPTAIVLVR
ncbi:MAG: phosphodiester glycosidase family protein [Microgenomates group bacterium]